MSEIIWNSVGVTVPDGWEPAGLERDSLILEHENRPVCELKWRTVSGTFSFEKHLKRLRKEHKGVDLHTVDEAELPDAWSEAVARLTESGLAARSFMWRSGPHRGVGAALHHPATGLAALIQFFIAAEDDETTAARTLATFRDYAGGKTVPFAMFGLAGRVPAEFRLDTFSFKPGHYRIRYWRPRNARRGDRLPAGKGPGIRLTFERFAPANVLLKSTDLPGWVADTLEDGPPGQLPLIDSPAAVSWHGVAKTSLLRRLLRRVHHAAGRVWHDQDHNAILAVTATGTAPVDTASLKEIAEHYGLV